MLVSKTFTTQETMANAPAAKAWGAKDFIAVTANVALAKEFGAQEVFPMWDWVGGRFSVWSAVALRRCAPWVRIRSRISSTGEGRSTSTSRRPRPKRTFRC